MSNGPVKLSLDVPYHNSHQVRRSALTDQLMALSGFVAVLTSLILASAGSVGTGVWLSKTSCNHASLWQGSDRDTTDLSFSNPMSSDFLFHISALRVLVSGIG